MYSSEKIIETKSCKQCNISFDITDIDLQFYDKISPKFNGEKIIIPSPSLCPDCRQQRRLLWRNESKLYKRLCDGTNKTMLLMYPDDIPYKVYNIDYWYSDNWNPIDYGMDINYNESFFEQIKKLQLKVPRMGRSIVRLENSDYSNNASDLKDSYLSFNGSQSEKMFYCIGFNDCNNCIDCRNIQYSDNCYECLNCDKCYNLSYGENCNEVQNSKYLKNCNSCSFCFACTNLNNKKYFCENIEYTKDEYEKKLAIISKNYSRDKFENFCSQTYVKSTQTKHSENVIGDYILNSKNVYKSFNISDGEDIRYSYNLTKGTNNVIDVSQFGTGIDNSIDSMTIGLNSSNMLFCFQSYENSSYLIYCDSCITCKNCLLCISLRDKEYCILNKQYTKEEYNILAPKILKQMKENNELGEFFPAINSPFFYNETQAMEYFPLLKDEAINKGFNWREIKQELPKVDKIISADKLPTNIKDIPDDILNWAIVCEITNKPFKIMKQELEFYRKFNLTIPKRHPEVRNFDRNKLLNKRKFYDRKCERCNLDIITTYSPNKNEKVYCEECYNKKAY